MTTTIKFSMRSVVGVIVAFLGLFVVMILASKLLGANEPDYKNLFVVTTKNESGNYSLQIIYNGKLGEGASLKKLDISKIEVNIRKLDDTHEKLKRTGTKEAFEPIFFELPPEGVKEIKVFYNGVVIGRG